MAGKHILTHRMFRQRPKEVYQRSFWDFLKTLVATGGLIFFFLMTMEWGYVSGFYETLGTRTLVTSTLEAAPWKYGIGTYLMESVGALISFGGAPFLSITLWYLFTTRRPLVIRYKGFIDNRWRRVNITKEFILFLIVIAAIIVCITSKVMIPALSSGLVLFIDLSFIITFIAMMLINALNVSSIVKWTAMICIGYLLIMTFSMTLYSLGEYRAMRILNGESSLSGVAIITNAPLAVSPAVDVDRGYNWRYYPREVPNTDGLVFSLQYVGEDENAVYILDYVARRVIVVPREEIHSMVLFPTTAYRQDVPVIVDPRVSTPVQRATFSPLPPPSPSPSPGQ